jgi:hypothetical protein
VFLALPTTEPLHDAVQGLGKGVDKQTRSHPQSSLNTWGIRVPAAMAQSQWSGLCGLIIENFLETKRFELV